MEKKISVVVPTYRRPALLMKCISALLSQDFESESYEVIVVSDGKDEETSGVLNSDPMVLTHELSYHELPEKKGPAAARNYGWRIARGKLIAFTDDDCIPDKKWLATAWHAYSNEEQIVYTGRVIVPVSASPTDHELNTANLQHAEFITANCFCTKAALEKTGGFDERYGMAWREDSDLQFNFMYHRIPIMKLPNAVVTHPVRKAPWGFSIKEQKKGMYNALLYKKYPSLYREKIQKAPAWNYYIMVGCVFCCIVALIGRSNSIAMVAAGVWLFLLLQFIVRRLSRSSRSLSHVLEMILTSIVIPFYSVYWQLYGSVKYRVVLF